MEVNSSVEKKSKIVTAYVIEGLDQWGRPFKSEIWDDQSQAEEVAARLKDQGKKISRQYKLKKDIGVMAQNIH